MFGSRASDVIHDGKAGEADRVSVLAIQGRLQELGQSITMEGWLGEQRDAAIREFQRSRGLTDDGLVGPASWKALWS
jgi:peptidoglycan hydrolase-like protein with peptidoglycan-binding domain